MTTTIETLNDALLARNQADTREIERIRATGKPMELQTAQLLTKLRIQIPGQVTDIERVLIPAMMSAFVEMRADFVSYQEKPTGCGCSGRLQLALARYPQRTQMVLDTVFGPGLYTHVITANTQMQVQANIGRSLAGTSAVIEATADAWSTHFAYLLLSHGNGTPAILQQAYKGVHVRDIEQGTKWLLLFY